MFVINIYIFIVINILQYVSYFYKGPSTIVNIIRNEDDRRENSLTSSHRQDFVTDENEPSCSHYVRNRYVVQDLLTFEDETGLDFTTDVAQSVSSSPIVARNATHNHSANDNNIILLSDTSEGKCSRVLITIRIYI